MAKKEFKKEFIEKYGEDAYKARLEKWKEWNSKKKEEFHKKYLKTPEFNEVRNAVFARDGHKCVLCGRTEGLVCHHTNYKYLGQHNQHEIDSCITLCCLDHLNHHRGKYNISWYSISHPRNNDDLREVEFLGHNLLVRSNGLDVFDAETFKRYKAYTNNNRQGRLVITIGENNIFIHRIVAKAFPEICGKWFEECEVHHLNKDASDNRAENLRVMSKEEHYKIHEEERNKRLSEALSKRVAQYTLSGNYLASYKSSMEAGKALFEAGLASNAKSGAHAIRNSISDKMSGIKTALGYIWVQCDGNNEPPLFIEPVKTGKERMVEKLRIPILQYDMEGNLIKEWAGIAEAAKAMGVGNTAISNCLNGRSKTCKNFKWKYKEEKFGIVK